MNNNQQNFSLDDLFFAQSFTKTDQGIDLEVNHLTVGCISSKENKFNLDEEGNLTVKTITTTEQNVSETPEINTEEILNKVYPIGSIYLSVNNVNPSTLFGGTWVTWGTGRVPVGVDTTLPEFNTVERTGGHRNLQEHTHTTVNNGAHTHNVGRNMIPGGLWSSGAGVSVLRRAEDSRIDLAANAALSAGAHTHTINSAGTGNAQNLQPYITCFMWKRTM